jgi:hypothetical protein
MLAITKGLPGIRVGGVFESKSIPQEVPVIPIDDAKGIEEKLDLIVSPFQGKETEHNWLKRDQSLLEIRGMLRGGLLRHQNSMIWVERLLREAVLISVWKQIDMIGSESDQIFLYPFYFAIFFDRFIVYVPNCHFIHVVLSESLREKWAMDSESSWMCRSYLCSSYALKPKG